MELFVKLDELDESLLKKAVSFIGQRQESAEEGALKVELIDITEAEGVDLLWEEIATPHATTTETMEAPPAAAQLSTVLQALHRILDHALYTLILNGGHYVCFYFQKRSYHCFSLILYRANFVPYI